MDETKRLLDTYLFDVHLIVMKGNTKLSEHLTIDMLEGLNDFLFESIGAITQVSICDVAIESYVTYNDLLDRVAKSIPKSLQQV